MNVIVDMEDGIYYCQVFGNYALMSVVDTHAEIHILNHEDKDYYGMDIIIENPVKIHKDLIINAAMHLYEGEILHKLGVIQYE